MQQEMPSTRPYMIRAMHEWCSDNGFTPYLVVSVNEGVQVPMEFVKNGEIVLNTAWTATDKLKLGNEYIEFFARFGGVARQIMVPVDRVMAIYARENGQGMAFPIEPVQSDADSATTSEESANLNNKVPSSAGDAPAAAGVVKSSRSHLSVVK